MRSSGIDSYSISENAKMSSQPPCRDMSFRSPACSSADRLGRCTFITHYYAPSRHESGQMNVTLVHRWPVGPRCHSGFLTPSSSSLPEAWCSCCASSQTFRILHTGNLRDRITKIAPAIYVRAFSLCKLFWARHSAVLCLKGASFSVLCDSETYRDSVTVSSMCHINCG